MGTIFIIIITGFSALFLYIYFKNKNSDITEEYYLNPLPPPPRLPSIERKTKDLDIECIYEEQPGEEILNFTLEQPSLHDEITAEHDMTALSESIRPMKDELNVKI